MARKLKKTAFNLSYSNSLSFNIGDLVPVYLEDLVPGDKFVIQPDFFVKFAPMVFPILQRIEAKIKYFFVPNRIMWKRWEKYITGGSDGTAVLNPPYMDYLTIEDYDNTLFNDGSLCDFIGYPKPKSAGQASASPFDVNLFPFYAYQFVWNEFFRDETLASDFRNSVAQGLDVEIEDVDVETFANLGSDLLDSLFTLRKVAWKKDYFTTASPWAQRGASVYIPSNLEFKDTFEDSFLGGNTGTLGIGNDVIASASGEYLEHNPLGTLNDFYKASALQRFLQKSINGNRYIEQILNFFGVRVPDYRLNRPQYIGGVSKLVQISEILQTSESTELSALGSYAGKASVGGVGKPISFTAPEHGWIIGVMFVRPDASYFQGVRKNLSRVDRFDYFWPEFQGIGEQPILKKELVAQKDAGDYNEQVWGYAPRFSEYKFHNNEIHGDFRSSLDSWTMARKFVSAPGLNAYFTYVDSDATGNNRVFAVPSADSTLYGVVNNNVIAYRPMLPYEPFHSV